MRHDPICLIGIELSSARSRAARRGDRPLRRRARGADQGLSGDALRGAKAALSGLRSRSIRPTGGGRALGGVLYTGMGQPVAHEETTDSGPPRRRSPPDHLVGIYVLARPGARFAGRRRSRRRSGDALGLLGTEVWPRRGQDVVRGATSEAARRRRRSPTARTSVDGARRRMRSASGRSTRGPNAPTSLQSSCASSRSLVRRATLVSEDILYDSIARSDDDRLLLRITGFRARSPTPRAGQESHELVLVASRRCSEGSSVGSIPAIITCPSRELESGDSWLGVARRSHRRVMLSRFLMLCGTARGTETSSAAARSPSRRARRAPASRPRTRVVA